MSRRKWWQSRLAPAEQLSRTLGRVRRRDGALVNTVHWLQQMIFWLQVAGKKRVVSFFSMGIYTLVVTKGNKLRGQGIQKPDERA